MKKGIWVIPENVYRSPLLLIHGLLYKDKRVQSSLIKEAGFTEEEVRSHEPGRTVGARWLFNERNSYNVIFLQKSNNIPAIAHELCHLVINLFQERGIKLDPNNDEPFTYLVEYFMNECLHKLGVPLNHYKS